MSLNLMFHMFAALELTSKKKKEDKPREKEWEKRITHVKYLMEKYGHLWLTKHRKRKFLKYFDLLG